MDWEAELRRHMQLIVGNEISLTDFRHWLEDNDSAIDDAGDSAVDLSADLWLILSEHDRGHWDTPRVKAEIGRLLDPYGFRTETIARNGAVSLVRAVFRGEIQGYSIFATPATTMLVTH